MSRKNVTDPFSEIKEYYKRIPGQSEAAVRRSREKEQNKLYLEHIRSQRREKIDKLLEVKKTVAPEKAKLAAIITAAASVAVTVIVYYVLFHTYYYLPATVGQFIDNFDLVTSTDVFSQAISNQPEADMYSLGRTSAIPSEKSPLLINNGRFYIYGETKGDSIISLTAGATEAFDGFDRSTGEFSSILEEANFKLFLVRFFYALDPDFDGNVNGSAELVMTLSDRANYGFSDYNYHDKYLVTFDFNDSLYVHVEKAQKSYAQISREKAK